ncbi:methyltransferase domain-containing protein [Pseudomonadota bacterium]
MSRVHRRGRRQASRYRGQKGLKLNIGCGSRLKPNFINLDFGEHADIRLDLRRPLPFNDHSCALVFSEHFLEHLVYPEGVESFLSECFRVLAPQGKILLSVPDTEWPLQQFCSGGKEWVNACESYHWHPAECTTFVEHLNFGSIRVSQ